MCHRRSKMHWIALYGVDTCSDARRAAFLDRVERRLAALTARSV
jgi:hypothetical protein